MIKAFIATAILGTSSLAMAQPGFRHEARVENRIERRELRADHRIERREFDRDRDFGRERRFERERLERARLERARVERFERLQALRRGRRY